MPQHMAELDDTLREVLAAFSLFREQQDFFLNACLLGIMQHVRPGFLSFPASRMRYIMNRANTNVGLKTREVETALKVKIAHELPSDGMIPLTINRGNPAVLAEPRCDFSKAIGQLAKQVAPQGRIGVPAPAKPQHRRRLSMVRS